MFFALTPAGAVPDTEKIAFTGDANEDGAIAAANFNLFNWAIVANRTGSSVIIYDLQSMEPVEDEDGDILVLDIAASPANVTDPVAVAVYLDSEVTPTQAYAFVAGFSSHKIAVIDLLATPPEVLPDETIDLTDDSDTATPGPVALLVDSGTLYVANGTEGTIQAYDIAPLPLVPIDFPAGSIDQTTAEGNLIVCSVGQTAPPASSARPRVLHEFSSRLWFGCNEGSLGYFDAAGGVTLRSDVGDSVGDIGGVRGLAGDPRDSTTILYVLDDTRDAVFAIDVATNVFEDTGNDPTIDPLCSVSGANRGSFPITTGAVSTALVGVHDASSNGGDFLMVLNTGTTSNLQRINLSEIDKNDSTNPECAVGAGSSIAVKLDLSEGDANFPSGANPSGIAQQMFHYLGYVGIPNFSVADGDGALTLVTDNPDFVIIAPTETALTPLTNSLGIDGTHNPDIILSWNPDESIQASPAPVVRARIKGEPLLFPSLPSTVTQGDTVTVTVTAQNLVTSGLVTNSSNERIEVVAAGYDAQGDVGNGAQTILFDSTLPNTPVGTTQVGDSLLRVVLTQAVDPDPGNGVFSGIGGFYIDFTNPPSQQDVERTTPELSFNLAGLTNNTAYTFDVYAIDKAGNASTTPLTLTGTPVPGQGIIELTGEEGCGSLRGGARMGAADGAVWIVAILLGLAVRRRKFALPSKKGASTVWGMALLGGLAFTPAPASAQVFSKAALRGEEVSPRQGRYWAAFEYEITKQEDSNQELIFGKDAHAFNAEGGWHLVRNLDFLLSAGFRRDAGHQIAEGSSPPVPIANEDVLWMAPFSASLRYRILIDREFPIVPYGRGGIGGLFFRSEAGVDPQDDAVWGFKWGVNAGGGILFRIDQLDSSSQRSLRADGIDALYLDTGFHWQRIDNFGGKGLDLSGIGGRAGLVAWIR